MNTNLSAALRHLLAAFDHVARACARTRAMLAAAIARLSALVCA